MARTFFCKLERHNECNGKVLMGAPEPITMEKCKCKCHKEKKSEESDSTLHAE